MYPILQLDIKPLTMQYVVNTSFKIKAAVFSIIEKMYSQRAQRDGQIGRASCRERV